MNHSKLKKLAALYFFPGALGALLYRLIYTASVDESSIIVRGSLQEIGLWVLTAVVLAGAAFFAFRVRFRRNGNPPAIGSLIYACGIYTLSKAPLLGPPMLVMVYRVMIWAAVASLVLSAVLALAKKPHFFLLDFCPSVLCILHLVECYQMWSEKPLLLDYFFPLGAVLCAALFFYHKMALRADLPGTKMYVFAMLAGIFFSITSAAGSVFQIYFLCLAAWLLSMSFVTDDSEPVALPAEPAPEE